MNCEGDNSEGEMGRDEEIEMKNEALRVTEAESIRFC